MIGGGLLKPQYVYRPAQLVRRLWRGRQRSGRRTVRLPCGLSIQVELQEAIGRSIWLLGAYELAVGEALWRALEPGDTAIDVGANIGYMTGLMALRVGTRGRLLAFEPHPEVYEELARNAALFGRDPRIGEIRTFPLALAEVSGEASLSAGEHFPANHGVARLSPAGPAAIPVETTTLDEVLGQGRAGLVKIDVEGAEARVLAGGRRALSEGRIRTVVYESHPHDGGAATELLRSLGYAVFALGMRLGRLVLSRPEDGARLPGYESINHLATREPAAVLPRLRRAGWRTLAATPAL